MRQHRTRRTGWTVGVALLLLVLSPVAGRGEKRYGADRFDVRIRLEADGSTRVTETVVFRLEGGTFTQVARELSRRRTDGIEVVAARLDGAAVGIGRHAGDRRLDVSRRDNGLSSQARRAPRWSWATSGQSTASRTAGSARARRRRGSPQPAPWGHG